LDDAFSIANATLAIPSSLPPTTAKDDEHSNHPTRGRIGLFVYCNTGLFSTTPKNKTRHDRHNRARALARSLAAKMARVVCATHTEKTFMPDAGRPVIAIGKAFSLFSLQRSSRASFWPPVDLGHSGVLLVLLVLFLSSVSSEPFRAAASSAEELKNENGDVLLLTAGAAAERQMRETTKAQQQQGAALLACTLV
jgi:hypothetical protein